MPTVEISLTVGLRKRIWVAPALRLLCAIVGATAYLITRFGLVAEVRRDASR